MNWLESKRTEQLLLLLLALAGFVLVNQLAQRMFFRWDLTSEKRYSINAATIRQLQSLEDVVTIDVYLTGELPAGFKRMRQALLETLDEFAVYADGKLNYRETDPAKAVSKQSRAEFMMAIARKGLQPTDVFISEDGERVQKRILAGVVVSYGSRELGVQLFKGNKAASPEERLNQSIEGIEYELANAIQQVTRERRPLVALASGHLEMDSANLYSFRRMLEDSYRVSKISMADLLTKNPDILLIIQPRKAYSVEDKYYLDQYIMHGGKAIFMVDKVAVNMDSAAVGTYSFPYNLNIDDMLFKYGVRVNNDLVQDYVAGAHPIIVGNSGDQPQIQLLQWPFFPVINTYSDHVIVRNLDASMANFISSIDTVKADGIQKTILFNSSIYARISTAPVYVDINILQESLSPDKFDKQNVPMAVLLEGEFTSYFKNRFLPHSVDQSKFVEKGSKTSMVVIADGDFVKTKKDPRNEAPLLVGYDPYMGQQFANGDLVMNAIAYLLARDGLINARAREIQIRPLDKVKIDEQRTFFQTINLASPIALIILLGLTITLFRKRKYARF